MNFIKQHKILILITGLIMVIVVVLLTQPPTDPGASSAFNIKIPLSYTEPLVIATFDLDWLITPIGARAAEATQLDENIIKYIDAYQNTDVVMTRYTNKLKEDIILKSPGHPSKFSYDLGDLARYEIEKDGQGNLVFYKLQITNNKLQTNSNDQSSNNKNLRKAFTIPAPYLIDADDNESSTEKVQMILEGDILTLIPDPDWLSSHPYPIILDPTIEIHVLNLHSHPQQGDDWIVEFRTLGTADLKIIPADQATIADDEFVSLSCGNELREPQILENDVIFYPNWQCNEIAKVIHYTKVQGRHHLRLDFGGQVANAFNAAAVNIDDASDFGNLGTSGRQVVRDSSGNIYAFLNDSGSCEIWRSTDGGSTWSERDENDNPTCTSSRTVAAAIDSSDVMHLCYITSTTYDYITFNTGTDQFGSSETIQTPTNSLFRQCTIKVDSNDKPHAAMNDDDFLGFDYNIEYSNRVGGSWKTPVLVQNLSVGLNNVSMAISEDDKPEITFVDATPSLYAEEGNQNDATSFTGYTVDATAVQLGSSIAVDSSGNTWIAYIDEDGATDYITLVKHNDADAWTTWQTEVTNSNAGRFPSIAINGTDVYVFYEEDNDDIAYDMYDGSWAGETTLDTGTYQDVNAKWSFNNNNQGATQIDYLFSDNTDVFWNKLDLGGGGSASTGVEVFGGVRVDGGVLIR